jgi:peptidoglycan hydrolase-like protein with peptidoglycan-binding domain
MSNTRYTEVRRVWCAALLGVGVVVTCMAVLAGVGNAAETGGQPIVATTVSGIALHRTGAPSAGAVQQQLVALRYLPASAVTGRWDYRTSQALIAFQAWQGLVRDGAVGPQTLAALATAKVPVPRVKRSGHEIEVYRALGVTLLVNNGRVVRAIHSSSGKPGFATPAGTYRVYLKAIRHWSTQYHVWLPYASFFNRGIAFHAYPDVPVYPASHGCIRIPSPEAEEVYAFAGIATLVVVF